MNPNSQHQMWGQWTFRIKPGRRVAVTRQALLENTLQLANKVFGSGLDVRVKPDRKRGELVVIILAEGHPVNDPDYAEYIRKLFLPLYQSAFGVLTTVTIKAKLMAGSPENGRPHAQLIILPHISNALGRSPG